MNPATEAEAIKLAHTSDKKGVVICPPFVYVTSVKRQVSRAKLGVQDVFYEEKGAYTGEVSALMLKKLGVQYVLVGHSERRRWLNETDEMINKKVRAALKAGLRVILCVGEPLAVRRKGLAAAKNFVKSQLRADLKSLNPKSLPRRQAGYILNSRLIVAYEPIWTIGTGKADNPKETAEMIRFIKSYLQPTTYNLQPKVLYGGSVTSKNVERIISYKEIDGALVGGASIKAKEFAKIIKITSRWN